MSSAKAPWTKGSALVAAAFSAETEREHEDVARKLDRAAKAKDASLRIASLLASAPRREGTTATLMHSLAEDPCPQVRIQVLESAKQLANRAAAQVLVEMLERESHGRVTWLLVGALQQVSGLLYRADPRPWRDWVATLPDDWHGATHVTRVRPGAKSSASLAGLPILSDRLIFLVDFSGSLWTKRADGDVAKVLRRR